MSYKILVIDHDPDKFEQMMHPLIAAGYDVVVATDADQGVDTFERMRPDLTMIEAYLPHRGGPQLCRELRQSEPGRSAAIVLVRDVEQAEDDQESLDGCGCDQVFDRPLGDEQLLELCRRILDARGNEAEPDATPPAEPAPAESDGFLDRAQLGDALGRLNLIMDGDGDMDLPARDTTPGVAEQRGDFSYIADELRAAASPQATSTPPDDGSVQATPEAGPETARPAAASLASSMAVDDPGDDIAAHLDTLFAGGHEPAPATAKDAAPSVSPTETTSPASQVAAEPSPPETAAGVDVSTAEAPAPAAAQRAQIAETRPAPAAARPAPPKVTRSQTEAAVPVPKPKVAPVRPKPTVHVDPSRGGNRLWLVAAAIAVVVVGGGLGVYLMRGPSPEPIATIADSSSGEGASGETIAAVGLSPRPIQLPPAGETSEDLLSPAATSSLPVGIDSELQTAPEPKATTTTSVRKPEPPKPEPKVATTRSAPKPEPPKPEPKVATTRGAPKPEPPKPEPKVVETRSAPKPEPPKPEPQVVTTRSAPVPEPKQSEASTLAAARPPDRSEPPQASLPRSPAPTPAPVLQQATPPAASVSSTEPAAPTATTEGGFHPPVVIERVEPVYSRKARKRDESGTVVINVLVSETGTIARAIVDQGIPGSELEAAAMSAVLRWKFEPATDDGKPVKAWTKAKFIFD